MMSTSISKKDYHQAAKERWKRMGMSKTTVATVVIKPIEIAPPPVVEAPKIVEVPSTKKTKQIVYKNQYGEYPHVPYKPITRQVVQVICDFFNVSEIDLLADRRCADLIYPRHLAFYLCKSCSTQSLTQIGRSFQRDHTTILSGIRKIERLVVDNHKVAHDILLLRNRLFAPSSNNVYWGA